VTRSAKIGELSMQVDILNALLERKGGRSYERDVVSARRRLSHPA
jgi:hypothetical protein